MSKLQEFYTDKEMRLAVYNHITQCAKDVCIEYATKEKPTDWFLPLLNTLQDSDRALDEMFNVRDSKPKLNKAR